ncbi:MAG: class I SAM-dependent methyltransferase [Phycisphaerales bacterium]|nr:class I SAM-dependent methyltransferase [Phycisphaerales bacterium]
MEHDYININKKLWDNKVEHHVASEFYDMKNFLEGKSSLKSIELDMLGVVKGKSILHLQCHFGQDSISLARMGASVTGIDFSEKAIEKAKDIALQTNADATFICTDVYSLPEILQQQFDIVFTTYGTIGWLPDMGKWAGVVAHFLKPGGKFIFTEFHPVVWMFDNDFSSLAYNYFNKEAIVEIMQGTYAAADAPLQDQEIAWNHAISEVLNALLQKGLTLTQFNEYDYSPYNCFRHTEEFEPGKFRIKHLGNKIPMVYSLIALK